LRPHSWKHGRENTYKTNCVPTCGSSVKAYIHSLSLHGLVSQSVVSTQRVTHYGSFFEKDRYSATDFWHDRASEIALERIKNENMVSSFKKTMTAQGFRYTTKQNLETAFFNVCFS
jgi:hypothetical protein